MHSAAGATLHLRKQLSNARMSEHTVDALFTTRWAVKMPRKQQVKTNNQTIKPTQIGMVTNRKRRWKRNLIAWNKYKNKRPQITEAPAADHRFSGF